MSKYKKVTISFATSTAEDQTWIVKFFPANVCDILGIIDNPSNRWLELNKHGRNAWWDRDGKAWKLADKQDSSSHYVQLSQVTDIHVEEVEVSNE